MSKTAQLKQGAATKTQEDAVDMAVMGGKKSPKILAESVDRLCVIGVRRSRREEGAIRFSTSNTQDLTINELKAHFVLKILIEIQT